jgi:ubiquinone/menaquinone biosynthesis C-methylase UbiE
MRKSMFEKLSAYYRAYSNNMLWPVILPLRKIQLRQLARKICKLSQTGLMLDIGTGYGYLPLKIAAICQGLQIIGIDLEPVLLYDGQKNALRHRLENRLAFIKARAETLPFANNTFDLVMSTMSLHLWKDRQQGINEIQRVLKPGGHALILVGKDYFLQGLAHVTDYFTYKSSKLMVDHCSTANFKRFEVSRIEEMLQIKAMK